jgi:hypothetical protein
MKMIKIHFYLLIFLTVGCEKPKEPKQMGLLYLNDFESIKGWAPVNLTMWPVHSGLYSNKLDELHEYSLGFASPIKDISPRRLKTVKVSEWVYLSEKCDAVIAMEVKSPKNKSLTWKGIDLDEQVTEIGKWRQITTTFSLRSDTVNRPDNMLNIYTWDKGKKDIYVDDIRIEFIEE